MAQFPIHMGKQHLDKSQASAGSAPTFVPGTHFEEPTGDLNPTWPSQALNHGQDVSPRALPRSEGHRQFAQPFARDLQRLHRCLQPTQQPHMDAIMMMLLELSASCMESWLAYQEQRATQEQQLQSQQLNQRLPNQSQQHEAEQMQTWNQLTWGAMGLGMATCLSMVPHLANLAPAVPGVISGVGQVIDKTNLNPILGSPEKTRSLVSMLIQPTRHTQALQKKETSLRGQDEGGQFRLQQLQDMAEQLRNMAQRTLQLIETMTNERSRVVQQMTQPH